jgi:hypothetical protein
MVTSLRRICERALTMMIGACLLAQPLAAQQRRLAPPEIGQIVDAVLSELLPPDSSLSRIPIAKRGVFLDVARTMEAFHVNESDRVSITDLGLRTETRTGSQSLLGDCDQVGRKPCSRLGSKAYVFIAPIRVTTAQARVRVNVSWADGGSAEMGALAPAGRRAFLAGFSAEVDLVRAPGGRWRFQKLGKTIAAG